MCAPKWSWPENSVIFIPGWCATCAGRFSRKYPQASRIFATDILGGHANILSKVQAEIRPIVASKCKLIESWIAKGQVRPVDPLNLFFIIWAAAEYYANFAQEINVFFGGKPMSDAQYDTAVQTVVDLVVAGCRPDRPVGGPG